MEISLFLCVASTSSLKDFHMQHNEKPSKWFLGGRKLDRITSAIKCSLQLIGRLTVDVIVVGVEEAVLRHNFVGIESKVNKMVQLSS